MVSKTRILEISSSIQSKAAQRDIFAPEIEPLFLSL